MKVLAGILAIQSDAIQPFQSDLVEICAHYLEIIASLPCDLPGAPFNLSLTKRADWLETNVIKPCERLRAAIGSDMEPMFSTWPYPLTVPKFRNNSVLAGELRDLLAHAIEIRDSLRGQQSEDAGHSQELRQEVFNSVARIIRAHCPHVPPNRGVYDPELHQRVGTYVDAMRLIFSKITGVEENLDRLIRGEIHFPS